MVGMGGMMGHTREAIDDLEGRDYLVPDDLEYGSWLEVVDAARKWAAVEPALEQLHRAIEEEGPAPAYHRQVMTRHRHEWPTLWKAIAALLAVGDR